MTYLSHRDPANPELARLLDLETVPPVTTTRWIARRKAQVVAAVQAGLFSIDEVCALYDLSLEEFLDWQRTIQAAGIRGLKLSRRRFARLVSERLNKAQDAERPNHV